jgi:negative regulator of sigma E activity
MSERLDPMNEIRERAEAETRATALVQARIAAEEALAAKSVQAAEAARRAAQESDAEKLSARRWPVLLAVASAVLLAFLLGLYVGWQRPFG